MSRILYTWASESNSETALQIVKDARLDVQLVDVRTMKQEQIPLWLDGVPTLLDVTMKDVYYGSECLDELERMGGDYERQGPTREQNYERPTQLNQQLPAHIQNMRPDVMFEQQQRQKQQPQPQSVPHVRYDDHTHVEAEPVMLNGRRLATADGRPAAPPPAIPDINQLLSSGGVQEQRDAQPSGSGQSLSGDVEAMMAARERQHH